MARRPTLLCLRTRALVALVTSAAVAAALTAQPAPVVERVDVELVLVDVLVTDRQGRPVLDLGREEFTLLEQGEPIAIEQFSPPAAASTEPSAPPAAEEEAHEDEAAFEDRFAVFLDELHLGPGSRRRVLIQLAETLDRVPTGAELLLASFDGAIRVEVPFTREHKQVRRAIEEKIRTAPPQLIEGLGEERLLALLPEVMRTAIDNASFLPPDVLIEQVCTGDLEPLVRLNAEQIRSRVAAAAGALGGFVDSLGGFGGRKVLLHVSDGIPLIAGQVGYEYAIELCDGSLAAQGAVKDSVPQLETLPAARSFPTKARLDMMGYSTAELWERLSAAANANRVTFYTLQASGLQPARSSNVDGARPSMTTDTADRLNQQDTLFALADATGGRATFNTNDFTAVVDRMIEDSDLRYELAFAPSAAGSGTRRLDVRVAREGVEVRHRKSYRPRSPDSRTSDRLLTALLHGRIDNPLAARLTAAPSGKTIKRKAEVLVTLRIPFERLTLLPRDEMLHGQVSVLLAARDEEGNRTGVGEKSLVLEVDPDDVGEEFEYQVSMELPSGTDYKVAAAVRDLLGGDSSFLTAPVEPSLR